MSRGWTTERRMQQSAMIHRWKPWCQSTGPRTEEGKIQASGNAYRGGHRPLERALFKALRAAMRQQKENISTMSLQREVF